MLQNYITTRDPSIPAKPRHIAYYDWGKQDNPHVIVCMHGLSRNAQDFTRLATALSGQFRVICPDMAGRGDSDWLTDASGYHYGTYLSDMTLLLETLRLKEVTWIGTSMGGIIGMMLAAQKPGTIQRMVLNDIGKTVSATGLKRIMSYVGQSGIFKGKQDAIPYMRGILQPFGITAEEDWEHMFDCSFNHLPDGSYALKYDPAISKPFHDLASNGTEIVDIDLAPFWNAVQCPVLIMRGADSDILTQVTAHAMQDEKQHVSLVEIANTGHAPALIDTYQIDVIKNWLERSRLT